MLARIRYVTRRVDRSGHARWYWQRRGQKLTRLPDSPIERLAMAERLNTAADQLEPAALQRGSLGWVVQRYRESDAYRELKAGTLKYYKRFLRDIEGLGTALPFASFTRRAVIEFLETYDKPHQRRQCAAVLKKLFALARYHGVVERDETTDLRLKTSRPRDRIWSDDEIARWIEATAAEDAHMLTSFLLLQYTAQRPGDVLRMAWPQYQGGAIKLRQQKTDSLLEIATHPVLRAHLDAIQRARSTVTIVAYRDRPVPYLRFNERFRRICQRAGVDAQARDLRRTAMIRMAEAGATAPQIASVSGHSIDRTQRILETYLPRNRDLAAAAIARLADFKKV